MKKTRVLSVSLLIAVLLMTVSISGVQGAANPAVLPPTARVQGKTLGEWGAEYWRAGLRIPMAQNPAFPGVPWPTCYLERIGNVGLIVGYVYSGSSECVMPAGMTLYVLVVASECSTAEPPPFYGANEEELRACNLKFAQANLAASIDGVPVRDVEAYTTFSPLYQFSVPDGNYLGAPAGMYESVAYNTAFLLAPLNPGAHTIHVHGEVPIASFIYDWVYYITVKD